MSSDSKNMSDAAKPTSIVEKLNKSGNQPMQEFKLGVDVIDKNVTRIDSGIRAISKKIHGTADKA
jgi:hypothetical protein